MSQVRIPTVAAGLDPTIGYLHACRPGRSALVYDLMEPLAPAIGQNGGGVGGKRGAGEGRIKR